jgi:hypothetical protein
MKYLILAVVAVLTVLQLPAPASANKGARGCSTEMLAGRWLFATGIGHQQLANSPAPPGDITALGTMNIRRNGTLEGRFDVTFAGFASVPDLVYSGSVILNEDCTGTLSFVTSTGSSRTDSIALVEHAEIWAMSRDPDNLWTYRVRRIARH